MFDRQKQKQNNIIWFLQKLQMSHSRKEEGAVFVIALCLGVIAISAVGLSLFNSAKSKTNTQANEFTKQAMAVTESGNSKTLEALEENPSLLILNYDPSISSPTAADRDWRNPPAGEGLSPCLTSTGSGGVIDYATLLGDTVAGGSYTVKSYQYDTATQIGTLVLKGDKDGNLSSAQTEIQLQIDSLVPPDSFPGLYGEDIVSLGNQDVLGTDFNIVCTDCEGSTSLLNCTNGEPSQAYYEDAFNQGNGTVQGNYKIGIPRLPEYPTPPSNPCSSTQGYPCYIPINRIKNTDTTFPRPSDVSTGTIGDVEQRALWIADLSNTNWNAGDENLPYVYILKNEGTGKKDSITGSNITINSAAGKVRWYVTGDLAFSGSSKIVHAGTLEKFSIFGCAPELRNVLNANSASFPYPCVSSGPVDPPEQTFLLNGNSASDTAFVYAPEARVGINGGGSAEGMTAVVWAYQWDASNSGTLNVPTDAQTFLANEYPAEFNAIGGTAGVEYYYIDGTVSWNRTAVN